MSRIIPSKSSSSVKTLSEVEEHLVSLLAPTAFEAEWYRMLRQRVEQMHRTAGLSVLAVTSSVVGEGKTTTAINLAGALAQAPEARVLLVEADLRHPCVGTRLGMKDPEGPGLPGLVDAILDKGLALKDVVRHRPPFNLSLLLAGRLHTAPYELLKSPRLGELLEEAGRQYEYIVLDTPPVIPVPDCQVLSSRVDGFLIVVAAHRTPRVLLEESLNLMDPAKVIGLVFNHDDRPLSGYYAYYYHYVQPA